MRSPRRLRQWVKELLPTQGPCAQEAAFSLVRAWFFTFTVHLCQLATLLDRDSTAKSARQYLCRWLSHRAWEPEVIYTHLARFTRRLLLRGQQTLLLMDVTDLADQWRVLSVSVPWQGRALPLYRAVYPTTAPQEGQAVQVRRALAWLMNVLPGPRSRYVLVADRGFPSQELLHLLQESGLRFVLRLKSNWKIQTPLLAGQLRHVCAAGEEPCLLANVTLGDRPKEGKERPQANVVFVHAPAHQQPWYLVTNVDRAAEAVEIYRKRMQIEAEFRDLKGPLGLDELAHWTEQERVERLLAWLAVYEWRLAYLWEREHLEEQRRAFEAGGRLAWIRITRDWLQRQLRKAGSRAPAFL